MRQRADPTPEGLAQAIGQRLHTLRKRQRLTLAELSQRAGVDLATICRIEGGLMLGRLACHLRLATALGVRLTELYEGIETARTQRVLAWSPPSMRRAVECSRNGHGILLIQDVLHKRLLPVLLTLQPGEQTPSFQARVGTERFLYGLSGRMEVTVGAQVFPLSRGGALYLEASVPHQLRNRGGTFARCLSVLSPPAL